MVALVHWNCCEMGRMAMLMFTRSMLHSMKATKHMATMPQRRCQPSWRAAARALLPLPLPSAPLNSPLPTTSP